MPEGETRRVVLRRDVLDTVSSAVEFSLEGRLLLDARVREVCRVTRVLSYMRRDNSIGNGPSSITFNRAQLAIGRGNLSLLDWLPAFSPLLLCELDFGVHVYPAWTGVPYAFIVQEAILMRKGFVADKVCMTWAGSLQTSTRLQVAVQVDLLVWRATLSEYIQALGRGGT